MIIFLGVSKKVIFSFSGVCILLIQHKRSELSVSPKGHDANYYSLELFGEEPVSCKDASTSICQCVGCIMGVSMRVSLLCMCDDHNRPTTGLISLSLHSHMHVHIYIHICVSLSSGIVESPDETPMISK